MPQHAVHSDMPTHLSDKAEYLTQSETTALAHSLGSEKGLEDSCLDFIRHAAAHVSNRNGDPRAGDWFSTVCNVRTSELGILSHNGQRATFRHCVSGIYSEVQQRGLQLVKVHTASLQRSIEKQFYPNLFAHTLFRQGKQVSDHVVQT